MWSYCWCTNSVQHEISLDVGNSVIVTTITTSVSTTKRIKLPQVKRKSRGGKHDRFLAGEELNISLILNCMRAKALNGMSPRTYDALMLKNTFSVPHTEHSLTTSSPEPRSKTNRFLWVELPVRRISINPKKLEIDANWTSFLRLVLLFIVQEANQKMSKLLDFAAALLQCPRNERSAHFKILIEYVVEHKQRKKASAGM